MLEALSKKHIYICAIILIFLVCICIIVFDDSGIDSVGNHTSVNSTVQESVDQKRVRHINLLKKSLDNALKNGINLPIPDKALEISFGDLSMGFQGKFPTDFYETIGLEVLLDPVTQESYYYMLSADKKNFEVMTTLENDTFANTIYVSRAVYYSGNMLDSFTRDAEGMPLVFRNLDSQKIDISKSSSQKDFGVTLFKSCKSIYDAASVKPKSGIYVIEIGRRQTRVYCDMQTDGGGWTLFYANNGHVDSPLKKSYIEMRDAFASEGVAQIFEYENPILVGLLNYHNFTQLGSKEILVRNRLGDEKKWVKFTFSTSRALDWALGPGVLGKTDNGCLDIPRGASWSIENNDRKIKYENLVQIMNHRGNSWGISHEKYLCNGFDKNVNPHIGFYDALSGKDNFRVRSNEGVGGKPEGDNEYRYYIR